MTERSQNHQKMYPYYKNGRFANYLGEKQEGLIRSLFMIFESLLQKTRGMRRLRQSWDASAEGFNPDVQRRSPHPVVTWVGHATFLINVSGFNILTDPIFGNPSTLFRRMTKPGLTLDQLPTIDFILLSHNHRDHMHAATLTALARKNTNMKILVPLGDKAWFDRRGFANVEEYTWWNNVTVVHDSGQTLQLTFLPAIHWSGRGVFDKNRSLWGSWMIQSSAHNLYFVGDTAYGRHFKEISREFGIIDTVLMPIGPCEPHEDQRLTHVNAEEAGQAFLDLGAHRFIPMHWGVFWFGTDYPLLPIERLQAWWLKNSIALENKIASPLKFGASVECKRDSLAAVQKSVVLESIR